MCNNVMPLINRIVGEFRLVEVANRKHCTLVMSPNTYEEFDEYLYSKMTEGHPSELWKPGDLKEYKGMPIVIDEECMWDFHIQHPKIKGK